MTNKFPHNTKFDEAFSKIETLTFYPYVGQNYSLRNKQRILVLAHNMPIHPNKYENEKWKLESPKHFANSIKEYVYDKGDWTEQFQNFISGTLGFKKNYIDNANEKDNKKIDEFIQSICYTNAVDGFVVSERKTNVNIPIEQIKRSKKNMNALIRILNPTHVICWGKAYDYVHKLDGYKGKEFKNLEAIGFAYKSLENVEDDRSLHVLKVHHPSMPNFKKFYPSTHNIFEEFLNLQ